MESETLNVKNKRHVQTSCTNVMYKRHVIHKERVKLKQESFKLAIHMIGVTTSIQPFVYNTLASSGNKRNISSSCSLILLVLHV